MNTYTQILYQVVFATKHRKPALVKESRVLLYAYIHGVFVNRQVHCYRIGGVEDHVHLVFSLNPNIALSDLIKDIKTGSTWYIKKNGIFPGFPGWQKGYGAFTYSAEAKENLIAYVLNQEEHHRKISCKDELIHLLKKHKIEFNENYLDK